MTWYARLLGAKVGHDVDLHTLPPVTGLLTPRQRRSVEPEVDLAGHWIDGDVGARRARSAIGERARVGARSMLLPGADGRRRRRGRRRVRRSSATCRRGSTGPGSPAERVSAEARGPWPTTGPPTAGVAGRRTAPRPRCLASLPALAAARRRCVARRGAGGAAITDAAGAASLRRARSPGCRWPGRRAASAARRAGARASSLAGSASAGRTPGPQPAGWQVWATMRVLDEARTWLFPLYSSALTPPGCACSAPGSARRRGVDRADDPYAHAASATVRSSPTTP